MKIESKVEAGLYLNITNSKFTDFYATEGSILYYLKSGKGDLFLNFTNN